MSILAKILAEKGPEVEAAMLARPLAEVEAVAREQPTTRDFAAALRRNEGEAMRFICEFKRASPSAGAIAPGVMPDAVVREYEEAGASAISVLTDHKFFDGRLEFLSRVRACVQIPVLRKDFIVHPYQVAEARAEGADAILLIVSALEQERLSELYQCAREWGMRALIEVHDEGEAERAAKLGAEVIGVNHRNLATFAIDLDLTARLARQMPKGCILVGESGIKSREHVVELREAGAHAVLVGESLMRAASPGRELRSMKRG
ncbi:MAG: indole-3-glycerol phosphate synthase TrpC [Myxococcales bacterium]|nr:indole-3-glycerol phosphate synthase TrpC [Myxococcales bacterium]